MSGDDRRKCRADRFAASSRLLPALGRFGRRRLGEASGALARGRARMRRARAARPSARCRRERTRGRRAAQEELRRALEIARRFGDRDLEALTLHNQGSVLIGAGEVEEGWALIDESAAAAAAGNLRPTATGSVYCWTITTCRNLQEVRRAGEWTARFEQWCERTSLPGGWRGDCRVHHAEVLRLHGRWSEAEAEAEAACEDFLAFNMPGEAGQATYELGEIQLRRGDLSGAASIVSIRDRGRTRASTRACAPAARRGKARRRAI